MTPYRIDVHYHIQPPRFSANERVRSSMMRNVSGLGWSPEFIKKNIIDAFTYTVAVEQLDRRGIATAIASLGATGIWFGDVALGRTLAREWNEDATQLSLDYPGRFGVFATIPLPDTEGSLKEIEYALGTLKADGICLTTSYDDKWLGDPSFAPVFEELNRRKAVVFVHPTVPFCCANLNANAPSFLLEVPTDTARTITSLVFSGTVARFPDIRFIFSHAGGTIMPVAGRLTDLVQPAAILVDKIPHGFAAELQKFYYDTAGAADHAAMNALRAVVSNTHILFGSDYPFVPEETVLRLSKLGLPADDLRAIERGNAQALLPRWRA